MADEGVAADQLRSIIERIERMDEEKAAVAADIKELYGEAKGNGFDTKVIRQIVRLRKMDHAERMEQDALIELYMAALGMINDAGSDDEPDETPPRPLTQPTRKRSVHNAVGFDTDGTA